MKVIILSKRFPASHPCAWHATNFGPEFHLGRKIHTIRANANGYYKDGDVLSVRQWSGKPYSSKQETLRDGVKIGIVPIMIEFSGLRMLVSVGGRYYRADLIAANDGLSLIDFYYWFNPYANSVMTLNYSLIHFTDFRYV